MNKDRIFTKSEKWEAAIRAAQGTRLLSRRIIAHLTPQEAQDYLRFRAARPRPTPLEAIHHINRTDLLSLVGDQP